MNYWGRLTLQSGKPRMDEMISSSVIYYTPFNTTEYSELSLDISSIIANNIYDIFLTANVLSLRQWDTVTKRGYDLLTTYIGSIYAANNGVVKWQTKLIPSAYGTNNQLGVYNAYNKISVTAICRDLNSSWQYGSSGLRYADNSNQFRINWLDGQGDVFCEGCYEVSMAGIGNNSVAATVGVGLNQNSYPINWGGVLPQAACINGNTGMQIRGYDSTNGVLGWNNWQAIEQTTSKPVTFFGNNFAALTIRLSI